jgi:hypothetical protein
LASASNSRFSCRRHCSCSPHDAPKGKKVAPWLAFAAGMLAAPGLLLKPYFLLVPLMLEAWLAFRAKRVSFKPENVA